MKKSAFVIIQCIFLLLCPLKMKAERWEVFAQSPSDRVGYLQRRYTKTHPLVYEDGWTKWPYSFINSSGEPDGFNVELVVELLQRLDIPFEIRLRDQKQVHQDLKNHAADLSLGVAAPYNAPYGKFGNVTICQFENSLMVPRHDSVSYVSLNSLRQMPILVQRDSRAHQYVKRENGSNDSLITATDHMSMAILDMVSNHRGRALWNTMSLKWLMRKYGIRDYVLVPTDIPPGEYRFMSADQHLLNALDSVCLVMQQEGEVDRIMNRWMYPEQQERKVSYTLVVLLHIIGIVLLFGIVHVARYYHRTYYSHSTLDDVNSQMALILSSNNIRVWVYDTMSGKYAWMAPDGSVEQDYSPIDFSRFYPDKQFLRLHNKVEELVATSDAKPITMTLKAMSLLVADKILDIELRMAASLDEYGKVYQVCGVQHNITDSKAHLRRMRILHERYKTAFNIAIGGIMRFDAAGQLIGINESLCCKLGIADHDAVVAKGYNLRDIGIFQGIDIDRDVAHDITFCTNVRSDEIASFLPFANVAQYSADEDVVHFHVHLTKAFDDDGNVVNHILYLRDITPDIAYSRLLDAEEAEVRRLEEESESHRQRRDYMLRESSLIVMRYYPEKKSLFFYDSEKKRMTPIPQLRAIEMVDSQDMKKAFRAFHRADNLANQEFHITVRTILRNERGAHPQMEVHMKPFMNSAGIVKYYYGICREKDTPPTPPRAPSVQRRQETAR